MVSTVKGTRFVIVSTKTSSIVTLTEGSLEVLDIDSGETQMLEPGDVAGTGAEQAGIQSHKHAASKPASPAGSGGSGYQAAMESEQASFESQLEGMAEIASEQVILVPGDEGSDHSSGNGNGHDDHGNGHGHDDHGNGHDDDDDD